MLPAAVAVVACLARSANPYLDEGKALYQSMQFQKAQIRLNLARQVATSTVEERREVYALLARCAAALGHLDGAEEAFAELLAGDAEAPAPAGVAPKILERFKRAKERLYPPDYVKLRSETAVPGRINVAVIDPWNRVASVVLANANASGQFEKREVPLDGRSIRAELGVAAPGQPQRWFLEAWAADGRLLANLGTSEQPLTSMAEANVLLSAPAATVAPSPAFAAPIPAETVQATASQQRPGWLAWGVCALAVGGAGVGAGLRISAEMDSAKAGLPTTWSTDTVALDQRARQKAIVADGFFVGAVLAAGAGALLFWTWR